MTELLKGSSSVFRIEAHMSLKTKYCHNVFDIVEFKERCTELLLEAADVIGIEITELGYDRNHVHLDIRWMRISLSVDRDCKEAQGNHRKETPEGVSGRQEEVLLGLRPVVTGYLRRQHGQGT